MNEWICVMDQLPQELERNHVEYDPISMEETNIINESRSIHVLVAVESECGETFVDCDYLINGRWKTYHSPEFYVSHWMRFPVHPYDEE